MSVEWSDRWTHRVPGLARRRLARIVARQVPGHDLDRRPRAQLVPDAIAGQDQEGILCVAHLHNPRSERVACISWSERARLSVGRRGAARRPFSLTDHSQISGALEM
jgi:hypothetical protein|eukprot:COSAG01_NODE_7381_length_3230_cov_1.541999_2_plen_107_part_00